MKNIYMRSVVESVDCGRINPDAGPGAKMRCKNNLNDEGITSVFWYWGSSFTNKAQTLSFEMILYCSGMLTHKQIYKYNKHNYHEANKKL